MSTSEKDKKRVSRDRLKIKSKTESVSHIFICGEGIFVLHLSVSLGNCTSSQ